MIHNMVPNLFVEVLRKLYPELVLSPTDVQRFILESHDHITAFFYMNATECMYYKKYTNIHRRGCKSEANKGGVCLIDNCPLPTLHKEQSDD